MNLPVILAVFKRNFISYFSSPIGYVFICAFVLLGSFAAFWPTDFFNANLANLDQLNKHLPWIMLIFIPAVTMGIWAEERRQGTDELLLTLPARDVDVVLGKYLAALAIFTMSLLFSLSHLIVLAYLADPDMGLLAANFAGYWLVGAAMIAVGMVASFLTNNLTVAFILAALFNAPLVFAAWADSIIPWPSAARFLKSLSISEQFRDFGRGVISLSAIVFFLSVIVVMLYLSMVLISRRHWQNNPGRPGAGAHFLLRAASLAAIAVGVNMLAARFDSRIDASTEKLSSLSPQTLQALRELSPQRPVFIDAYVSPDVPEQYVQTRLNLLSMLSEIDSLAGDNVVVRLNATERYSDKAAEAREQYGIAARPVQSLAGGRATVDQIFLSAAVMSGLDKVVIPFFDIGNSVEYELLRALATVSQQKRKTVGVVTTDAELFGGFDPATFSSRPPQQIITELQQQYTVTQVNPAEPISQTYDVLLAVQPSSVPQAQLANFIDAVKRGQPTVIFEDPFPGNGDLAATSQPRMPKGGNNPFNRGEMPEPKGDIRPLWELLQVDFSDDEIVCQDYNPYPKLGALPEEIVFVSPAAAGESAFSQTAATTRGLQQLVLLFTGHLSPRQGAQTQFTPLLKAAGKTGVIAYDQIIERDMFGRAGLNQNRRYRPTGESYTLAARIAGTPPGEGAAPIDAAIVADGDLIGSQFFAIQARGERREDPVNIRLDNVAFVLNLLDEMARDDRFIEVRKRRPLHRTLTKIEQKTQPIRDEANAQRERFMVDFEAKEAQARAEFDQKIEAVKSRKDVDPKTLLQLIAIATQTYQQNLDAAVEKLTRERDRQVELTETQLAQKVREVQDTYKLAAVAIPPLLPLLLAVGVYFMRSSQERIGVPAARMK